jgi:hypothetical protein
MKTTSLEMIETASGWSIGGRVREVVACSARADLLCGWAT